VEVRAKLQMVLVAVGRDIYFLGSTGRLLLLRESKSLKKMETSFAF
jgi:hypothetical protein